MKRLLRRLGVEKLGIEPVEKHSRQDEFTKETPSNLTTLDTIGLVLLTVFPLVLLASIITSLDNHQQKEEGNE